MSRPRAYRRRGTCVDDRWPIRVETWSDVVCPWCYIGKRRTERALATLDTDPSFAYDIEFVYQLFQLGLSARRGVTEPVTAGYARKLGGAEQAAAMIERVTAAAAAEGIELRSTARGAPTRRTPTGSSGALGADGPAAHAALKESLM